jgi:uncharacterized protein (TIGR02594 family)
LAAIAAPVEARPHSTAAPGPVFDRTVTEYVAPVAEKAVKSQRGWKVSVKHASRAERSVRGQRAAKAAPVERAAPSAGLGGHAVVAEARRYLGGNPTGRSSLWCAAFMNLVLERSGHRGTGSNMARSFANYGTRVSGPQVGAIAVMSRGRRGGHVGIVSGVDGNGNPIIISGNHGRRVAESTYSRGRIYAYVLP